jgi:peptidyl-prolyl cis-trans isomerase A (cyclophilin A)
MRLPLFSPIVAAVLLTGCSGGGTSKSPDRYRTKFETTKGDFVIEVIREWSPLGADRFHELVTTGFFDSARFFRILPGFVVQFGLKGDPAIDAKWEAAIIEDDPAAMSNTPATVTFATRGTRSRTTQVFINLGDNSRLDTQGFTPFGRVTDGMQVVASLYSGYGEAPDQSRIKSQGNSYLQAEFPMLDYIKKASVVP